MRQLREALLYGVKQSPPLLAVDASSSASRLGLCMPSAAMNPLMVHRHGGAASERGNEPAFHLVSYAFWLYALLQKTVLWYLPEYKIVIISTTYAYMSLSQNVGRASSHAQDL